MDMLRKLRITAAFILFTGLTLLFLDFTGTIHAYLGWMAKIQFLTRLKPVRCSFNTAIHHFIRKALLLNNMPARIISGYCRVDYRKKKEKQIQLQEKQKMAAIRNSNSIYHFTNIRFQLHSVCNSPI